MAYIIAFGLLIGGFTVLIVGGEALVKSSVSLACRLNVSPAVIGMTIIAAGTSAPELLTSILATLQGTPDIALGNVVGSNIFNILAILGTASLLNPNKVAKHISHFDFPLLLGVSLIFYWFIWDRLLSRSEGFASITLLIIVMVASIRMAKKHHIKDPNDDIEVLKSPLHDGIYLAIGIAGLIGGAHLALMGGIQLGTLFELSERIIGITIISVGTGLPELATSAVAAYRGRDDIAVANVVGSNIMNTLAVAGGAASISSLPAHEDIVRFDGVLMLAATALIFPVIWLGKHRIGRKSGALLGLIYVSYIVSLIYQ